MENKPALKRECTAYICFRPILHTKCIEIFSRVRLMPWCKLYLRHAIFFLALNSEQETGVLVIAVFNRMATFCRNYFWEVVAIIFSEMPTLGRSIFSIVWINSKKQNSWSQGAANAVRIVCHTAVSPSSDFMLFNALLSYQKLSRRFCWWTKVSPSLSQPHNRI